MKLFLAAGSGAVVAVAVTLGVLALMHSNGDDDAKASGPSLKCRSTTADVTREFQLADAEVAWLKQQIERGVFAVSDIDLSSKINYLNAQIKSSVGGSWDEFRAKQQTGKSHLVLAWRMTANTPECFTAIEVATAQEGVANYAK